MKCRGVYIWLKNATQDATQTLFFIVDDFLISYNLLIILNFSGADGVNRTPDLLITKLIIDL